MRWNPLLKRELNLRMREWNAFWIPFLYVGTLCLLFGTEYAGSRAMGSAPWRLGQQLFRMLSVTSVGLLGLAVPVFAAGSLTVEREQRTLAPLLLTCLSPREIVSGKLAAAAAYGVLLISTSLPVVALTAAFGGVSPPVVALHYLSLSALALALAAFGVFVSAWFKRSVYAIALSYGALALLLGAALFTAAVLSQIEQTLGVPLLRRIAFMTPLFFLDERTRWQWPLSLAWFLCLALLLREGAVARLEREGRQRS